MRSSQLSEVARRRSSPPGGVADRVLREVLARTVMTSGEPRSSFVGRCSSAARTSTESVGPRIRHPEPGRCCAAASRCSPCRAGRTVRAACDRAAQRGAHWVHRPSVTPRARTTSPAGDLLKHNECASASSRKSTATRAQLERRLRAVPFTLGHRDAHKGPRDSRRLERFGAGRQARRRPSMPELMPLGRWWL